MTAASFSNLLTLAFVNGADPTKVDISGVLAVARDIQSAFLEVTDYACDIEALYFQEGVEKHRYLLKYFFRKKDEYRIEFIQPYRGMVVLYRGDEKELTVKPFRLLQRVRFRYSIDHPLVRTPAGQRVNQMGIEYFLSFLFRNLHSVPQDNPDVREEDGEMSFWLRALDYLEGKTLEKYHLFIMKKTGLPSRIERYDLKGQPIEITIFRNYRINTPLDDLLFIP